MPDVRSLLLSDPLSANSEKSCLKPNLPGPIYAVASPANGSGKTSLCCALVAALPGSTAIKFTTVKKDGSRRPRGSVLHIEPYRQRPLRIDLLRVRGGDVWKLLL